MIKSIGDKTPKIAESAYISESACIIGDVEVGEGSGIWPGAVLRGDFAPIRIGCNSQIEDNSVLHGTVEIGDNVIIGHGAVVHGAPINATRIGNSTLIGNNACILDDTEIGEYCIIGAGSVVTERTKIPSQSLVIFSLKVGTRNSQPKGVTILSRVCNSITSRT